jgi:nucleoside-diphosphate-sugar epimerase
MSDCSSRLGRSLKFIHLLVGSAMKSLALALLSAVGLVIAFGTIPGVSQSTADTVEAHVAKARVAAGTIVKRIVDGRRAIPFSADMAPWRATKGYVEDVGAAIVAAAVADRATGRIYNVGEADTLPELVWAQQVARVLNWDREFELMPDDRLPAHLRAPGNTAQHWMADTTRIREELGFRETITREEAICRTVEWERANPPTGFTPHQFDYPSEDEALTNAS